MLQQFVTPALLAGGLALGAVGGLLLLAPRQPPALELEVPTPPPTPVPAPAFLWVHVSGAVERPGLVRLREGQRVADAVAAAGGLTPQANAAAVNLARRLRDEEQVHVPQIGEAAAPPTSGSGPGAEAPVDLNRASAAELEALPGIGPTLAGRILERRERVGAFQSVEDLLEVRGIGPALLAELEGRVTVR